MHMMHEMCTISTWQTGTFGQRARWRTSAEVYAGKLDGEHLRVASSNSSSLDVVETSFLKPAVTNGGHVCERNIGRQLDCSMWAHAMDWSLTCISLLHCKHTRGCMLSLPPHFFRIMHWSDPINMDSCQMFCMTRINTCNWKVTHSTALQCMSQCIPGLSLPPQPTHDLGWACRRLHIKNKCMHW